MDAAARARSVVVLLLLPYPSPLRITLLILGSLVMLERSFGITPPTPPLPRIKMISAFP